MEYVKKVVVITLMHARHYSTMSCMACGESLSEHLQYSPDPILPYFCSTDCQQVYTAHEMKVEPLPSYDIVVSATPELGLKSCFRHCRANVTRVRFAAVDEIKEPTPLIQVGVQRGGISNDYIDIQPNLPPSYPTDVARRTATFLSLFVTK